MRKVTSSTLLVGSAAIALLLLANPLVLFNLLLQPVQAQTPMTFKTPKPANIEDGSLVLTFDAQGNLSTNSPGEQPMNGTFQIKSLSDGMTSSGDIERGRLSNNSQGVVSIVLVSRFTLIETSCSTSATNGIIVDGEYLYRGAVDCDLGGDTTAQSSPSSSMTGTTTQDSRDGDADGIPDSSDRCTHNSNSRCFKEDT